jgi:rhamnogalacturonyl hydrolase YesR
MKLLPIFVAFLPLSHAADSLAAKMADSMISRGVTPTRYYAEATYHRGIEAVFNLTQNVSYLTYLKTQVDAVLDADGNLKGWNATDHQLDNIKIGSNLIFLYQATGSSRYRRAASFLHRQLDSQERTRSGGFWHKARYTDQMWLDGLYMAEPFNAAHAALFAPGNESAWADILLQFELVEAHCRDPKTGLMRHGYDESKKAVWADPATGAAPHVWDRAVGWYLMALVDVLDWLPAAHPGRGKLLGYFTTLSEAMAKVQDESGGWWLVIDFPGRKKNYIESSGTAMVAYAWLKGVRLGYLPASPWSGRAEKAYKLLVSKFVSKAAGGLVNFEGTVRVGSLDLDGSFDVSFHNCVIEEIY